ncbi:RNA polymerase sigma factor [Streptomyces sp. RK9]|uniref:RNA polymerase sigma factor n=1 Tax=Streptomyces sp. RK9 TaxID=3239284 RepID=UPI00386B64E3
MSAPGSAEEQPGDRFATSPRTPRSADPDLAKRFLHGDQGALAEAYRRWGGAIHALALRFLPERTAEASTSRVFVDAWRNRASSDPVRRLGLLLLDGMRREIVRQRPELGHDEALAAAVDQAVLRELLSELPPLRAAVLELTLHGSLTATQTAERLGVPTHMVRLELGEALASLKPRGGGKR